MTSSTDQEVTSFPEPSLSCFKWSGPVVELAAVQLKEKNRISYSVKITDTYFLRPREQNSTFDSSVCAHRAQFGWVGADAAQGRRRESLSGEKRSLLLGRSVVGSVRGCVGVAGRSILGRVVIGNAVLRVRHWFCFESRVRKALLSECEHSTRCRCAFFSASSLKINHRQYF